MKYLGYTIRILPIVLCLATPTFILITYVIAVYLNHVTAVWPYISDTGTIPPESCIFGLFLNTIAFLFIVIVYLRYKQVKSYTKLSSSGHINPWRNRAASVFGIFSCIGLNLVANFQEKNVFFAHIVGALMCFCSGTIFFIFQTLFTQKMYPSAKLIFALRIVLTVINIASLILTFVPVRKALSEFKGEEKLLWSPKDGGYTYHLISTISEWVLVFSFCAYIGTFYWDFKKLRIDPLRVRRVTLRETEDSRKPLPITKKFTTLSETSTQTEDEVSAKKSQRSFWLI